MNSSVYLKKTCENSRFAVIDLVKQGYGLSVSLEGSVPEVVNQFNRCVESKLNDDDQLILEKLRTSKDIDILQVAYIGEGCGASAVVEYVVKE